MDGSENPRQQRRLGGEGVAGSLHLFMQSIGMPNGLQAVGYTSADIPALAEGTLKQKRLVALSPQPVTQQAVEKMLEQSLVVW